MSQPTGCRCPDDSGSCDWCRQHYCGHADIEGTACLDCGQDVSEFLAAWDEFVLSCRDEHEEGGIGA